MGPRDHPSLSEDPVPAGRHPGGLARGRADLREAGQEQAEADHAGDGREAGQGVEGGQVCGVLGTDAGLQRNF